MIIGKQEVDGGRSTIQMRGSGFNCRAELGLRGLFAYIMVAHFTYTKFLRL